MNKRRIAIAIFAVCAALLTACAPAIAALPQTAPDVLLNITDEVLEACKNDYPLAAVNDTQIMHSDVVMHRPLNPDMSDEELLEGLILLEIAYDKSRDMLCDCNHEGEAQQEYEALKAAAIADGATEQERDRYERVQQYMNLLFADEPSYNRPFFYYRYVGDRKQIEQSLIFYKDEIIYSLPEGLTEEQQEQRFVKHLQQLKKEYEITYYKH